MPVIDTFLAAGWGMAMGACFMRWGFFSAGQRINTLNGNLRQRIEQASDITLTDDQWQGLTETEEWKKFQISLTHPNFKERVNRFWGSFKQFKTPAILFSAGTLFSGASVDLGLSEFFDVEKNWELFLIPTAGLLLLGRIWFVWRLTPNCVNIGKVKPPKSLRNRARAIRSPSPVREERQRSEHARMTLHRRISDGHRLRPATSLFAVHRAISPRAMSLRSR